jgi:hypothetical protein
MYRAASAYARWQVSAAAGRSERSIRIPAKLTRRLRRTCAAAVLAVAAGCAPLPQTASVAIPPVPPGAARIWVYRAYEPYTDKGLPAVSANGATLGYPEMGGAFFRDVPPGRYHVTVESYGVDVNQSAEADIAPGQEAYIKIVSLPSWVETGDITSFQRPTFYAWLVPGQIGRADVAHLAFQGGG